MLSKLLGWSRQILLVLDPTTIHLGILLPSDGPIRAHSVSKWPCWKALLGTPGLHPWYSYHACFHRFGGPLHHLLHDSRGIRPVQLLHFGLL